MREHTSRALPFCTVQSRSGSFCDQPMMEGVPFPICGYHARKVARHVMQEAVVRLGAMTPAERDELFWDQLVPGIRGPYPEEEYRDRRRKQLADRGVVYYVDFGDFIKIGTTANLRQRLVTFRAEMTQLLATEPGYRDTELIRHRQFAHLRTGPRREDFRPEVDLLLHIKAIRDEHGLPSVPDAMTQAGPVTVRSTDN